MWNFIGTNSTEFSFRELQQSRIPMTKIFFRVVNYRSKIPVETGYFFKCRSLSCYSIKRVRENYLVKREEIALILWFEWAGHSITPDAIKCGGLHIFYQLSRRPVRWSVNIIISLLFAITLFLFLLWV